MPLVALKLFKIYSLNEVNPVGFAKQFRFGNKTIFSLPFLARKVYNSMCVCVCVCVCVCERERETDRQTDRQRERERERERVIAGRTSNNNDKNNKIKTSPARGLIL